MMEKLEAVEEIISRNLTKAREAVIASCGHYVAQGSCDKCPLKGRWTCPLEA